MNFLTASARRPREKWWRAILTVGLLATTAWGLDEPAPWPAFLPPRQVFSPDVAAAVERTWSDWTFSRTVRGQTARVPFELYVALIDSPDVTAAAARHRNFAKHEVRLVAEDLYEAQDHDGSRGFYRVLAREPHRRVIYSWGEHTGSLLGSIQGDALTVLALEPRDGTIDQTLTAYVRIDNRFAAALARVLILLLGGLADRRLSEAFVVAARVGEWAVARPDEFCGWLLRSPVPPERRLAIQGVVAACP